MNYLEAERVRCERRIAKIEANPDPTKLRANRLLYELERDLRVAQMEAAREGRLALCAGPTDVVLKAMGFEILDLNSLADKIPAGERYFEMVDRLGYPRDACDRTITSQAFFALGDLPLPNVVVSSNTSCEPVMLSHNAIAHYSNVPLFFFDNLPLERNEKILQNMTEQFGELIEFVESRFPGMKFDEDKLREIQEIDRIAYGYMRDMYELRKHIPCPIAGRDAFRVPHMPCRYSNPAKALSYIKALRDEMYERTEKGVGVTREEKLRIIWLNAGPIYWDPFAYLERRGVVTPLFMVGLSGAVSGLRPTYGDETQFGRKLSPLEEEARMSFSTFNARGSQWVAEVLTFCRELKIDAIVNFLQPGCIPTLGISKMVEVVVEHELGIPVLQLAGRTTDETYTSRAELQSRLAEFIDMCLANKGGP